MGVLPLQFPEGRDADSLGLTGEEVFTISGVEELNEGTTPRTVRVDATHPTSGASRRSRRSCASTPPGRPTTTATAGS
jgi:aconitate hydratase